MGLLFSRLRLQNLNIEPAHLSWILQKGAKEKKGIGRGKRGGERQKNGGKWPIICRMVVHGD